MNYELANRLKEAGFMKDSHYWDIRGDVTLMPYPTLSELIEACYDSAYKRKPASVGFTLSSGPQDGKWGAEMFSIFNYELADTKKVVGAGSTPEEAVANLWLELNK